MSYPAGLEVQDTATYLHRLAEQSRHQSYETTDVSAMVDRVLEILLTHAEKGETFCVVSQGELPHGTPNVTYGIPRQKLVEELERRGLTVSTTVNGQHTWQFNISWAFVATKNVDPPHAMLVAIPLEEIKEVLWSLALAENLGDVFDAIDPLLRRVGLPLAPIHCDGLKDMLRDKGFLPECALEDE